MATVSDPVSSPGPIVQTSARTLLAGAGIVAAEPFPHVVRRPAVDPGHYAALRDDKGLAVSWGKSF